MLGSGGDMENSLTVVSDQLVRAVQKAGQSVVALDARRRFPASGIWWRPGVIVTAEHAIKRDEEIGVQTSEGKAGSALLVGRDAGTDIAVLKMGGSTAGTGTAEFAPARPQGPGGREITVGRSP